MREPLPQRPDMIGESGGHGGCARLITRCLACSRALGGAASASDTHPQCPHGPAEVVGVVAEVADRLVNLPVLAEAIGAADFAGIAVAVGAVVAFQKRRVDGGAGLGALQCR